MVPFYRVLYCLNDLNFGIYTGWLKTTCLILSLVPLALKGFIYKLIFWKLGYIPISWEYLGWVDSLISVKLVTRIISGFRGLNSFRPGPLSPNIASTRLWPMWVAPHGPYYQSIPKGAPPFLGVKCMFLHNLQYRLFLTWFTLSYSNLYSVCIWHSRGIDFDFSKNYYLGLFSKVTEFTLSLFRYCRWLWLSLEVLHCLINMNIYLCICICIYLYVLYMYYLKKIS